jgi:hypothetical protein
MRATLTSLYILSKTPHRALELGSLRVQHMPDMVVHLRLIMLRPSLQRCSLRQHSITRLAELRVDSREGSRRALRLRSTKSGRRGLFLGLCISERGQYSVDVLETLRLTRPATEVVGGPAIEPGEIRNEERILDVGQGGEGRDLGV